MKSEKVCLSEAAYIIGILMLALGTSLMEKANFGMSMVVAPAYLVYLKISQYYPAFTFGMAEYMIQAVVIILLTILLRRFKKSYLFSFVTAAIYGFSLDFMIMITAPIAGGSMTGRVVLYIVGTVICAAGVAFLFNTYIAPEAYELFVKEISAERGLKLDKVKIVYDFTSLVLAVLMSFAFFGFGQFKGVHIGTLINAAVNGWLIGCISDLLQQKFVFKDALGFRELFNK